MGSKFSSLCSKKKTKKTKEVQYSPKTTQEIYNDQRTHQLIYPPISSILREQPKRSLTTDGRPLYQSVHMDSELDKDNNRYQDEIGYNRLDFPNYYSQYNDGTFSVLSRYSMNQNHVFRL